MADLARRRRIAISQVWSRCRGVTPRTRCRARQAGCDPKLGDALAVAICEANYDDAGSRDVGEVKNGE